MTERDGDWRKLAKEVYPSVDQLIAELRRKPKTADELDGKAEDKRLRRSEQGKMVSRAWRENRRRATY
jgi:hypothetical protein